MYSREERTRLTGEINDIRYVCVYSGCITLLPKIVTHEELQGPAYNFVRNSGKRGGGCPLIRACSVITSNTVHAIIDREI